MSHKQKYVCLVPAAGVGARMRLGYPKQYLKIDAQKCLLEVTLERLRTMGFDEIVVVVSPTDPYINEMVIPARVLKVGGATRGESVLNGLMQAHFDDEAWAFVHDAARPCVQKDDIEALKVALEDPDIEGAILAQSVTDTVKWVRSDGTIEATLERTRCFRAQTPQVFKVKALKEALSTCAASVTDESQAMEKRGTRIKIVEGSPANIKVTRPEDLVIVQKFFQHEE